MDSTAVHVLAAILVGGGLTTVVVGLLLRLQRRSESLAELLELTGGEGDVPVEVVTESPEAPSISRLTVRIGELVGRLDTRGALTRKLARAEIPMKTGEYLFLAGTTSILLAILVGVISGTPAGAVIVLLVGTAATWIYPGFRAGRRTDKLRQQLPDAFSLIASSVASGHTFLRSIQILGEQIPAPLSGELQRVVSEVTLGSNLIDALENMAVRVEIVELHWAVKAVRIQQSTGGQLSELLHTLADFMRARDEVYREVKVLSAEGRFSGYVLMALPVFVTIILLVVNPTYLKPMFHGLGLLMLIVAGIMLAIGHFIIRRMVNIEV